MFNEVKKMFGSNSEAKLREGEGLFGDEELFYEDEEGEISAPRKQNPHRLIFVAFPKELEDAATIIENLRDGSICIVNINQSKDGEAIKSHLQGAVYYAKGLVETLGEGIFLFAPEMFSTEILNALKDEATAKMENAIKQKTIE